VPVIVLTRRQLTAHTPHVELRSGDLAELVRELRTRYASIWMVGGATLATELVRSKLADELRITIAPIMLGGGTSFVDALGREQPLHLKDVTAYKNGFVEICYELES
jgi:riboflavin biosynthesis pyrimidine reductase